MEGGVKEEPLKWSLISVSFKGEKERNYNACVCACVFVQPSNRPPS